MVVSFKKGVRVITFFDKVHDANSFTLLPLDRKKMCFVGLTPDRKTIINVRLNMGVICVNKYLFWDIMSYHSQYSTPSNQSRFHMIYMTFKGEFVVNEDAKVFCVFFFINRKIIYSYIDGRRRLLVVLSEK